MTGMKCIFINIVFGTALCHFLDLISYNSTSLFLPMIVKSTKKSNVNTLDLHSHLKEVLLSGYSFMPVKQTSFIYLLLYTHE